MSQDYKSKEELKELDDSEFIDHLRDLSSLPGNKSHDYYNRMIRVDANVADTASGLFEALRSMRHHRSSKRGS